MDKNSLQIETGTREGYISDNALTIAADILRGRTITEGQKVIFMAHDFTSTEIANVAASVR